MKKIVIKVTSDDIKNGLRGLVRSCPIAIASNRRFHTDDVVAYTTISSEKKKVLYATPRKAKNFIRRFDIGKKVVPFSFEVRRNFIKKIK